MNKLFIVILVMVLASMANAELKISVNEVVNDEPEARFDLVYPPAVNKEFPDSTCCAKPSDAGLILTSSIPLPLDDLPFTEVPLVAAVLTQLAEPVASDEEYPTTEMWWPIPPDDWTSVGTPYIISRTLVVDGVLIYDRIWAYERNEGGTVYCIYVVDGVNKGTYIMPEPATLLLLGLGGLILRKRKA